MKFARTIMRREPAEVAALAALLSESRTIGSFNQHGDDRAPIRYDLFAKVWPEYDALPFAVATREGDGFTVTDVIAPTKGKK